MGMTPLSWQDIHAFCSLFGYRFSQTELTVLRLIDSAYFTAQSDEKERQDKTKDGKK